MIESNTQNINASDHHDRHDDNIVMTDAQSDDPAISDSESARSTDDHINQEEEEHNH